MSRFRLCAALLLAAAPAFAQPQPGLPLPRIDSVTPGGAKAGTTVAELILAGTDLDEANALLFGHPGIKAELIPLPPPPKVDPKAPPPPKVDPKIPLPPGKFKITVAADVPPGNYDVRAVNKYGVSNPRAFVVGDLPEVMEKEPNNDVPEAMKVEINTTINGTIASPTDVDLYLVTAKKGQRLILACMAASIDSKAHPVVELYDASSHRLASHHGPDAVADAVIPADGDYFIRVAEFTYTTGGPQHFYRLTITTNPWIDAIFPPMIEPGKAAKVTLYGRNLPGGVPVTGPASGGSPREMLDVTITAPATPGTLTYHGRIDPRSGGLDGFEYRLKGPGGTSNPVLIAFAGDPVVAEVEPNDTQEQAMNLTVPCEVAGRVDHRNDRDWYAFTAKKGESFIIDLWADRLGTPADFAFTVRAAAAKTDMVEKDDTAETLSPVQFFTRTSDPEAYKFTAPADGKYLIQVTSREASFLFGPSVGYRLRVAPVRPDFRLVAMPASDHQPDVTMLRPDGHHYLEVYAFRTDGFTGPINLAVTGLPAGVTCVPQVIGNGQRSSALVLSAAATAAPFIGPIAVTGTATIDGKPVVHAARSATIIWGTPPQQNAPTLTRLDSGLILAIRDKAAFRVTAEPENAFVKAGEKLPQPLAIKQGEKLTVPFKVVRISPDAKVAITLQQVNTAQNPQQMPVTANNGQPLPAVAPDKADGTIVLDAKPTAIPGPYTVVLKATAQIPYDKDPAGKAKKPATVEQAVTPITVLIIPLNVAKVTATPAGNLKAGLTTEVVVKVERQFDYAGEFKVKLVLPAGTKGVTADDITIPAKESAGKFVLKAAADVAAGQLANVVAQATALYDGKYPVVQEVKFNVTVEKAPPPPKKEEPKKEVPKKKEEPKKK